MRTRRRLLASVAAAGSASLSGCDALRSRPEETADRTTETTTKRSGDAAHAVDVVVENVSPSARYVTVVVEDDGEELFAESESYAPDGTGQTRRYSAAVPRFGEYDVVVETADGAAARGTVRVDTVHGDAEVTVGEEIRVRQGVRCSPGCGPVSVDGEFERFRDPSWPGREASAGYAVSVANVGDEARPVEVEFEVDDRLVLEYRYRPHPGTELRLPVVPPLRRFALAVTAAGRTWRAAWDDARSAEIPLAFDGRGVRVDAWPGAGADLTVRNERGRRDVTVEAYRDGERVAAETVELGRGERARVADFLSEPGVYDVRVVGNATVTRTFVVARRGRLLVRARDGVDVYLLR